MSHIRIFPWSQAPMEFRRPFGRKRRQWLAYVPRGCEMGEVNWRNRIETTLDGATLIAGTEPTVRKPRGP